MNSIGRILQLARYPVKSMRGESLHATTLTLQGVPEDRRYAFVQAASRSDFPWLTARQMPDLLRYQPAIEVERSGEVVVAVTTPSGERLMIDSEDLRREIETRSGRALFLLHDGRGSYDAAPISMISLQTVARIAEESETVENPWRFRPNLLVDLKEGNPFDELKWVGRVVRIGDVARVAIIKADGRCVITTLDPETTKTSPSVLRSIVQNHQQCAGVYGTVLTPGEVHTGDAIWLES